MKLNDPFGRVERRKENSYQSLRQSLLESGVDRREAAEALLKGMLKRALIGALVLLSLVAILVLLLPQSRAAILLVGLVILLWLLASTLNAYGLIRRYIAEELASTDD
ncbi:MAG: hypothetical protein OQL28_00910 [Sedimenticola sp.]|nr:hypothetical protein [Sedimenticola sp.]